MTYEEALTYLTAHGQQHLLRYYPTLTPAQQEHLLEQISNLHLERPQFQNREAAAQQRGHFARRKGGRIPQDRLTGNS